jgi:L-fuculose-phosphate aldolase
MLEAERERVAAAARRLAEEGLVLGTAGNISQRAGDRIAVTPSGAALANLDPGDMVIVDLDGNRLEGHGAPTSELDLHLGVYRRYGAGAVVHMHAPFATALACVIDELPAVHYQLLALGGPIRVAPYATFGSPELAQLTLDALQGRSAALMANHGAIVHGQTSTRRWSTRACWSGPARCTGARPRSGRRGRSITTSWWPWHRRPTAAATPA